MKREGLITLVIGTLSLAALAIRLYLSFYYTREGPIGLGLHERIARRLTPVLTVERGASVEALTGVARTRIRRSQDDARLVAATHGTPTAGVSLPVPLVSFDEPSPFLPYILQVLHSERDIVCFTGPRVQELFDTPVAIREGLKAQVSLNGKAKTRVWSDIAHMVNQSAFTAAHIENTRNRGEKQLLSGNTNHPVQVADAAIHVHNQHKLGDLLEHIILQYKAERKRKQMKELKESKSLGKLHGTKNRNVGGAVTAGNNNFINPYMTREEVFDIMNMGQPPIVMTNSADENWGFLSTAIGTRTTKWLNMTNHLKIHGADYSTVKYFLDSPKIALITANTHVDPKIGYHPKLINLPLGLRGRRALYERLQQFKHAKTNKTRLLLINNSGWGDRNKINNQVSAAFNGTVRNLYMKSKSNIQSINGRTQRDDHYLQTVSSKFVLCPSGLGFDTYRLWETLLLGAIPVVESNAGFDPTYNSLPVLVVRNYSDVTPRLLYDAYPCFVRHAAEFSYEHLTHKYWMSLLKQAIVTGSNEHVVRNHPPRHKYCDFMTQ